MSKGLGRTHEEIPKGKKKSGGKRKKSVPSEVSRALYGTRELLAASKTIHIEQRKARDDLKWAELALESKEFKVAIACLRKADKHVKETLVERLPEHIKKARDSIRHIERLRGRTHGPKQLLEKAKRAFENGDFNEAINSLRETKEKIKDIEQETVLRIMFRAKEKFVVAKKDGLNIDKALNLLKLSRESLRDGRFPEAVRYAEEGEKAVDSILKRDHKGRKQLTDCMKAVRTADLLGAGNDDMEKSLKDIIELFRKEDMDKAIENARNLSAMAKKAAYDKAAITYELAERSLGVGKEAGIEMPGGTEILMKARQSLENDDPMKSFSLSTSIIVDTNSAIMDSLRDRLKNIDQFSKGIEGEVQSLNEVQEAIEHSKERSLDNFRKYAKLSEELVSQAFESAIAYTRVSQDAVKQAFDSSVSLTNGGQTAEGEISGKSALAPDIVAVNEPTTIEEKRMRIINIYIDGKIGERQLEKLLTLIDSSVAKVNLI